MRLVRGWFAIPLWKRVLGALALGLLLAVIWPEAAPAVQFMGDLFVRAIRMLVVPIVLVTIASGITALGDPKRIGGLGGRTVGLFALTTAIAVSVGMAVASLVRPGVGAPLGTAAPHAMGTPPTPYEQLIGIIPLNIFDALAKGDMLAIIFVAILLGVGTLVAGEAGRPFAALLQSASAVLLRIVGIVMEATPFGVFALIANAVAANGAAVFVNVGWLALAVLLGSAIQILLVHSLCCGCSRGCRSAASFAASSMRWSWPSRPHRVRRPCRWRCASRSETSGWAGLSMPPCFRWGPASARTAPPCMSGCSASSACRRSARR
jgi:Na+/H+-dicarboxylate symporter